MSPVVKDILNYHKPPSWSDMSDGTNLRMVNLPNSSSEFQHVEMKIRRTLAVTVRSVQRVQNPFLWGCYTLKKEEIKRRCPGAVEKEFFHATSSVNAQSICKVNFDWRRSWRVKYGAGVSFSPSAEYANRQSNRAIGQYHRAMIIAKTIVGVTCAGSQSLTIPWSPADTSVGNCGNVYVKYYDHEFYPEYVAYYDNSLSSIQPGHGRLILKYPTYSFDNFLDTFNGLRVFEPLSDKDPTV